MVVLLPAPLGPSRLRISPFSARKVHALHGLQLAEALLQILRLDRKSVVHVNSLRMPHSHRPSQTRGEGKLLHRRHGQAEQADAQQRDQQRNVRRA